MIMSRHRTTGQNLYIKVTNKSSENVTEVKIFGNDGNKSKLNS
jgi:hypothetical protein